MFRRAISDSLFTNEMKSASASIMFLVALRSELWDGSHYELPDQEDLQLAR